MTTDTDPREALMAAVDAYRSFDLMPPDNYGNIDLKKMGERKEQQRAAVKREAALMVVRVLEGIVEHDTDGDPFEKCYEEIMDTAINALADWRKKAGTVVESD